MFFQNYIIAASPTTALNPVIMIYLVPLAMILSVLGWMYLRRRQHAPPIPPATHTLLERQTAPQLIAQRPRTFVPKTQKTPPPLPASLQTRTESAESTQSIETTTEPNPTTRAEFSIQHAAPRRHCTHCKQFFDADLDACPHDGCAPPHAHPDTANTANNQQRDLHRAQCTQCGRRYEEGTRYCYVDGTFLTNDTPQDAAHAKPLKVCRVCGQEAAQKHERCPHDDTELTLINPGNLTRLTPAIPLLICSKCRQYAMPGTAFCPNDGELLTPLLSARFAALPASGFGPRRKLCRKCGTRFSDACTFCSQDGTPLTPIN